MKKINENKISLILAIVIVLVVGAVSFLGGIKYQQGKIAKNFPKQFDNSAFSGGNRNQADRPGNATGQNGVGQRRMGNNQSFGEITSVDDKSITIKTSDGSSRIILLSNTTTISKSTEATKTDLKVGEKVVVFGTPNNDGSISGTNIELNPSLLGQMAKTTVTPTKTN